MAYGEHWRTVAAVAIGVAVGAASGRAQNPAPRISAVISSIRYDVTADSAATQSRHLGVTMTFTVAGTEPVLLSLPAWSPGHYQLLWFARRVSQFEPEAGGRPLEWHQVDFQTWEIRPREAGEVRVHFEYLADTIDRAVAWTQPSFAFFLGTNLFLYPVGRGFDWPATVTIHTEPDWRVTTAMPPADGPNRFGAADYHDLVDMPFFVGRFDLDSTFVADRWIRLAWYPAGSLTPARRDRMFGWLGRFVPAEVAVFRDTPFRNYTIFQVSDSVVNGGGLEHQSSQMDEITTGQLDAPWLPGLYSHEFFHAWNVKRLRPADMVPYRYDDAQPTRWLWVSEGVTSYYGGLAQVRGGVVDSLGFLNALAGAAASVAGAPATALGDASLSAWIAPTDGSGFLYYPGGQLAGFLLDIMIRDASDNRHSLDDVMRELYETTWKRGTGFTPAQWWGAVERNAGTSDDRFRKFAERYVDGREPFPFDSILPLAGLRLRVDAVGEPGRPRVRILVEPDASTKAARIQHGIFSGTTDR